MYCVDDSGRAGSAWIAEILKLAHLSLRKSCCDRLVRRARSALIEGYIKRTYVTDILFNFVRCSCV